MDFDFLKQKRILLVDDEQELLDMVSSIFADEGFCNLKTAKTVKEAVCCNIRLHPPEKDHNLPVFPHVFHRRYR